MGYAVYWTYQRSFTTHEWENIRQAVCNMFQRLKQVKGPSGTGRPEIDAEAIHFNGDASKGEDHESFYLDREGEGFNFCKTARKPYDRYVKAVLVVANYYAPGALDVTCDGDDEPGCWAEGVRIASIYASLYFGRKPCSPLDQAKHDKMNESAIAASSDFQATRKSTDISHSDPYKGVYPELDNIIKGLEMVSSDSKPLQFIVNYLKANIDDIKDAYTP